MITLFCQQPDCIASTKQEFGGFSAARRFAKEHVKHTGHRVVVERSELHVFEVINDL